MTCGRRGGGNWLRKRACGGHEQILKHEHSNPYRQIHIDKNIGIAMGSDVQFEEKRNVDGAPYWNAIRQIGSLFGSPVDGQCEGIGRTKEEAVERLQKDEAKLAESLWAF